MRTTLQVACTGDEKAEEFNARSQTLYKNIHVTHKQVVPQGAASADCKVYHPVGYLKTMGPHQGTGHILHMSPNFMLVLLAFVH